MQLTTFKIKMDDGLDHIYILFLHSLRFTNPLPIELKREAVEPGILVPVYTTEAIFSTFYIGFTFTHTLVRVNILSTYRLGMRAFDDNVSYTQQWKSKLAVAMGWGIEPLTFRLGV